MAPSVDAQFIQFLESELAISDQDITFALQRGEQFPEQLPMILWHHDLISLEQLARIFDWLEVT